MTTARFYEQKTFGTFTPVGDVTDKHGAVEIPPNLDIVRRTPIHGDRDDPKTYTPEDGKAFIEALPKTFDNGYFFAQIVPDESSS